MDDSKTDNDLFAFDENKGFETVMNNKEIFNNSIKEVERNIKNKNYEMALMQAFEAASFAVENHPGCFTSPELEALLIECGQHLPDITINLNLPEKKDKRRVFHIMSEGFYTGGHTRLVRNWIEQDKDSIHYLITTWQIRTMPQWVIDSVGKSGGLCISLDTLSNSYLERAALLREITHRYADIIVCHTHMNDPIPVIAFGIQGGPPVILLNHGDHLFWLGSCIADIVFNLRPAAQKLTLKRRNVKASTLLPIPLIYPQKLISKELARKELGLAMDTDVIISIATKKKYNSFSKNDFFDFLKIILQKNKNAVAIIVGPGDEGKFQVATVESNGRIKVVGEQAEIEKYYSAADIYLDSYMFSSLTSALDAGLRGIPVVSLKNCINEVLSLNDISFEGLSTQFTILKEYIEHVDRLVKDKDYRNAEGKFISDHIKADHIDSWKDQLDRGYALVENTRHALNIHAFNEQLGMEDLFLALYLQQNKR